MKLIRLFNKRKELTFMLNNEINELREKLDNAILRNEDYSIIYNISIQLDELIAKYYRESKVKSVKV